ncbi:MAG TPA: DUF6580 family putative transport protein [Terriglobales bacterium]|nr:DUF6580 family putative transport protein [Terriglobales bacterium]
MLAYIFVIFAIAMRMPFLPHPWNFTPVAAALLYFGARGSRRQLWIPFALFAASDVILTRFVYGYQFTWDHYFTWLWYAAILRLGTNLRENTRLREAKDWLRVGGATLAGSVSFFIVSNFAVWACWPTYPKSFAGLMTCYAAGVPFFRHTLEGDLLFAAAIFGLPALAAAIAHSDEIRHVTTA